MNMKLIAAACIALMLNACASYPSNVKPAYTSPMTYQNLKCQDLTEETRRLQSEVDRVTKEQRESANADTALMTVGLVLFWPALFGLAATTDHSDELARLKGELQATEQASHTCQQAQATPPALAPNQSNGRICAEQPNGAWKCS